MRIEIAIAITLACGGWVCDDDNPCVGANTCDTDVAKVCCPFDQRYWCDGACFATADCHSDDVVYACHDEAPPPSCAFSATISSVACVDTGISGNVLFEASGSVTGCGDEGIYIARADGGAYGGLDCGDWTLGQFRSSCLPTGDTTRWAVDDGPFLVLGSHEISFAVMTGTGDVLATMTTRCN
jgi:hypothetical protein